MDNILCDSLCLFIKLFKGLTEKVQFIWKHLALLLFTFKTSCGANVIGNYCSDNFFVEVYFHL